MAWNSCRDCFNNKNNKNSFHLEKEDLVLLFERERETVDDRAEDLQELGLKIASVVYPGSEIDPVSLGMPNSFPPGSGYQEPYHLADASLDHRFYSHPAISNPQGGILFVGELDADFFRPG